MVKLNMNLKMTIMNEKNPLKALDYDMKSRVSLQKSTPSRDIMDDIKLLKRAADYMNTSFHSLYNQTKTAIDYYTGDDGFYDFQDFMNELAHHTYDAQYLEYLIEDWYANEEIRYYELGPEGYEAYYNTPEVVESLPYTLESLLWDLFLIWMEMFMVCELYLYARPELKEIEDYIVESITNWINPFITFIKYFNTPIARPTDVIIFDHLWDYCVEMARRSRGEVPMGPIEVIKFYPSPCSFYFKLTKLYIVEMWQKCVDIFM